MAAGGREAERERVEPLGHLEDGLLPAGVELWRAGYGAVVVTPAQAAAIEAEGWDGAMAMDSQSLSADPYVVLAAMAVGTTRLLLGTSVTNPYTRHPAVTAGSMVSLQALSGGRAVLGIGRGDSSLAFLGRAPMSVPEFERCLVALQGYLSGDAVPFDALGNLADLPLGGAPEAAQLRWIPEGLAKVPLEVAATGPRVISAAARIAERVTVSVGAIPERLSWAVGVAHDARRDAGLVPDAVSIGAQIIVVPHPDRVVARDLARDIAAPLARFSTINGRTVGPVDAADEAVFEGLRRHYDMSHHGQAPAGVVTDDFVDRFAIVGPPEECIERLSELVSLGVTRFVVCRAAGGVNRDAERVSNDLFVREVMPAVRAAG